MTETMAASRSGSEPPEALIKKPRGISIVWVIPIVAAVIAAFLAYRAYTSEGPTVTISFETAEGLEAGKTKLRFLNVEVGTVETVIIAEDHRHIEVTARMVPSAATFLREKTTFWIVKPRIGVGGVSGLGTLLSGAYIGLAPGDGEDTREFVGLEDPPPISANVPGREYTLTAATLGSVGPGAPIYYRGIDIGQVLSYELTPDARALDIKIFVKEPFHQLVRTTSRFWNASGISIATGASGIDVNVASVQSLLSGGIEFDTPLGTTTGAMAEAGTRFPLFPTQNAVGDARYTDKIPFVVYFDGSVRGLNAGAPVEFRGIKIGTVTGVHLEFDPATRRIRIPVSIEIEPQRLLTDGATAADAQANGNHETMADFVKGGLRAQLQTGNLLTGELFVDLTIIPNAPPAELDVSGPVPVIPSVPATLEALQASATTILNKIAALPIEQLVGSLTKTAAGVETMVNSPELRDGLRAVGPALKQLEQTIGRVDADAAPLLASLKTTSENAAAALRQAQATLAAVQRTIGPDSALTDGADTLMSELTRAARSIRVFADYLDRHPEALIRGKTGGGGQ